MGAESDQLFNTTLRQRQVSRVLDRCQRYRAGERDAWGMRLNMRGVATSLENDVPQLIRDAINGAEAGFEGIAFGDSADSDWRTACGDALRTAWSDSMRRSGGARASCAASPTGRPACGSWWRCAWSSRRSGSAGDATLTGATRFPPCQMRSPPQDEVESRLPAVGCRSCGGDVPCLSPCPGASADRSVPCVSSSPRSRQPGTSTR